MKNILNNNEENKDNLIEKLGKYSIKLAEEKIGGSVCLNWIFYEPKISDELIKSMK